MPLFAIPPQQPAPAQDVQAIQWQTDATPHLLAQAILPNGAGSAVESPGNQLNISGGTQGGNNLFHSFDRFNLNAEQTAIFLANPTIENILGRINGGQASRIDGQLQITGANANLFLINPAGIIFGPHARLNLPGAFTASTSDRLSFGNSFFNILGSNDYSQLLGNPDGFAFSTSAPAGILNQGNLSLTPGQQLNLIGGSITSNGKLSAPGGQVNVVASPGNSRVRLGQDGATLTITANALATPDWLPPSFSPVATSQLSQGNVALQQLEARGAIVSAHGDVVLQGSELNTTADLVIAAGDRLTLRDSNTSPFVAKAGGNLTFQGGDRLDILALSNPQTLIQSGSDLRLISDNAISADAHFTSGGDFSLTNTRGENNAFISLYDPIIRAAGNVTFGDYNGTALKVEATGSISTGNIVITGPDVDTIPTNDPDFAELTTLPSVILRAGTSLTDAATTLPTTAGGSTFTDSSPAAPNASITITGDIDTSLATVSLFPTEAGNITLSAPGNIVTGLLNASLVNNNSTSDNLTAGNVTVQAGGVASITGINTSVSSNTSFANYQAGDISITSGNGLTLGSANSSVSGTDGLAFTAGDIDISVTGDASLGILNSSAASPDAFVSLEAGSIGASTTGDLQFTSATTTATGFEVSPGTITGNGGTVSLSAAGTLQGSGIVPGGVSTIETTGTNNSGSIELSHDGGPNNVAFETGDASLNGVAGELTAGSVSSSGESFANAGVESRGPNGEISLTFTNGAPNLNAAGSSFTTPENEPLTLAIADLNLDATDPNSDNLQLEIAALPANGSLSRNGSALSVGDTVESSDVLTYTPGAGGTGVQTAFALQASDRLSTSAALNVPVNVTAVAPVDPFAPVEPVDPNEPQLPLNIPETLDSSYLLREAKVLEQPSINTQLETRLLGMPLTQAPAISELSVLRGVVPEAPLLMLPVNTWNVASASGLSQGSGITGELQLQPEATALANAGLSSSAIAGLESSYPGAGEPQIPTSGTFDGFDPDAPGFTDTDGNPINPDGGGIIALDGFTAVQADTTNGGFTVTETSTQPGNNLPEGLQANPFDPGSINDFDAPDDAIPISAPFDPSGPGSIDSPAPDLPDSPSTPNPNPGGGPNVPSPGSSSSGASTPEPSPPGPPSGDSAGPIATAPDQPSSSSGGSGSTDASSDNDGSTSSATGRPGANNPAGNVQNCPQQVAQAHQQTKAGQQKQKGLYTALISCFEQNLAVAEASNDQNLQLYALNNLGSSYFVVGDYLKALDTHQQQLTAAEITGDATQIGIALSGMGAAHAALGNYDEAIAQYQRSLSQLPSDKALQWRGITLRNLGNAYLSKKNYSQAVSHQTQSLQLSKRIKDRYGEMQALGNLGNAYTLNGEFDAAIAAYEPSLTLARELGARLDEAQTLLGLGTTASYQKQYEQAIAYNNESLVLLTQLDNRLGQGIVLTNLGDAHYQLKQFAPAETNFRQSIEVWESLRAGLGTNDAYKVSIFETQRAAYRNLQELLAEQNRVGESLEIAEQSRGRAFVELLARGNATTQANAADIAPPNLAELQRIAREQNATLVEYSLAHEQFVETPHGASVQYASEPQDSKIIIWTIQPSGQVDLRQVDLRAQPGLSNQKRPSLKRLVQVARRCMNDRSCVRRAERNTRFGFVEQEPVETAMSEAETQQIAANNPLYKLHQLLIDPITDLLPQSEEDKVIFVPQDHLFLVPFPALQAQNGSYLIDRHTVMTSPSIQLLAATKARSNQLGSGNDAALVVGNPAPMPKSFSPLPFTEDEANTVGNLLGSNVIIGSDATEAIVKQLLPQAGTIHLATHGIFNAAKPLEGAIALAPEGVEDGLLTAGEILKSRLQARLVVLSACDTGRGRITGDGVIGLSRSFLAAGASSVMVSLWQVPDDATSVLMTEFHRNRQSSTDNAQALRQAMLTVKKSYDDPLAWSGFTLVGEP